MAGSSAKARQDDGDKNGRVETKMEERVREDWERNNGERVTVSGAIGNTGGDCDTTCREVNRRQMFK